MRELDPYLHSPVQGYLARGNIRPSAKQLESFYSQLSLSSKPSILLVAADVCTDLASADTGSAAHWLDTANSLLESVRRQVELLDFEGCSYSYACAVPLAVQAQLRQTELPKWKSAIEGKPIKNDYENMLTVSRSIIHNPPIHPAVYSALVEFMPLVLGSRRLNFCSRDGWMGRLSLSREDKKAWAANGINTNWDTGITNDDDPQNILKPPIRIQIKTKNRRKGRSAPTQKSGVIPIQADQAGFAYPRLIIESCLAEACLDRNGSQIASQDLLSPTQLDAITDRIAAHF